MNELEVRTGYFANAKKYQQKGYLAVAISLMLPRWATPYVDHRVHSLAPTQAILDTLPDEIEYTRRYKEEILGKLDPKKVYDEEIAHYAKIRGKDKVVLLCYENADKFCHRHIVADWLNESLGTDITEIRKDELTSATHG